MKRVGILNIGGYAGVELARILHSHPHVQLTSVAGRTVAGQLLADVFPHLSKLELQIESELSNDVEFVFSALPHAASAEALIPYIKKGIPVVDMSADFRLRNPADYESWYGSAHPDPKLLSEAIYGLTELNREALTGATLVANPGCYPTGVLLALAPAVAAGIIGLDFIIDSKSGVSGAGRTLSLTTHFSETNDNVVAYGLGGHRHLPEIVQELACIWQNARTTESAQPRVTFTPHLVPMTRGILSTCYADLLPGQLSTGEDVHDQISDIYHDFYKGDAFVQVVEMPPATKQSWGSNTCTIHPTIDLRTGRLVVVSAIDNLVKGAAGQAVQNMNLMMGFPETAGLEMLAIYP